METDKTKKLAAAILLTLLIWVSVFLALEEQTTEWGTLNISKEITPDILVSFVGEREPPIPIRLTLKGPNSMIAELRRKLRGDSPDSKKLSLDFYYNSNDEGHTEPGDYNWNVLAFLKNSDLIKDLDLGLVVEDCDRKIIKTKVERLIEKQLPVQCVDERDFVLKHENITPPRVAMFVPRDWDGPANVALSGPQIERARKTPVPQKPYIVLNGKPVYSGTIVTVELPAKEQSLALKPVLVRIGFLISDKLIGKYKVELRNEDEVAERLMVQGTPEAIDAYQKMRHQILIEVQDGDENATDEIVRDVTYHLPQDYLLRGEIRFPEARQAIFKLVPVSQ